MGPKSLFQICFITGIMICLYLFWWNQFLDLSPSYLSNKQIINQPTRLKACLHVLVRNDELKFWIPTMKEFEEKFNSRYNYPYLFVNDVPFTDEFKAEILKLTNATVEFGLIPKKYWSIPSWIDLKILKLKNETSLRAMWKGTVISYHHMCRYYSGFFFRHELTLKYDYFWRLEPNVSFPCQIPYDPFQKLAENNISYGFSISRPELMNTIPTLWWHITKWLNDFYFKDYIAKNNSIDFISDDKGRTLLSNACTFFNNFEIGAFSVFRDQLYLDYFDYLDKTGGFYYERWGDSAVNTFYLALMLKKSQLHFFEDIAYFHPPRYYCPNKLPDSCNPESIKMCNPPKYLLKFALTTNRCVNKWKNLMA